MKLIQNCTIITPACIGSDIYTTEHCHCVHGAARGGQQLVVPGVRAAQRLDPGRGLQPGPQPRHGGRQTADTRIHTLRVSYD